MTTTHKPSIRSAAMAALRPGRFAKDGLHLAISATVALAIVWLATTPALSPESITYAFGGSLPETVRWWFPAILAGLGVIFLPAILAGARLFAVIERARARALLDVSVSEPAPTHPNKSGPISWIRHQLTDATAWRALLYVALLLPLAAITISYAKVLGENFWTMITTTWYAGGNPIALFSGWPVGDNGGIWIIQLLTIPFAVALLAKVHRVLVTRLLSPSAGERARMLERGRDYAVDTAIDDLRRIERDLHDGVQARLVSLTMELGRGRKQLESDPQAAGALLERAHADAKLALAELRDLARGIYPAVLTDRGLDPALSALAARMPIPIAVNVTLPGRPPTPVETAGYFVITELLTNVAKHSEATSATVTVRGETDRVAIEVTDDGHGNADPTKGSGLVGLSERVAALEGRLSIYSPTGGPTRVTVEIPCRQYHSVSS